MLPFKSVLFSCRLKRDLWASEGQIVLVYQMSKVGSTSVYQALRNSLEIPIYHTHFLSATGIRNAERFFREAGAAVPSNIRYSAILRNHLPDMRPIIITLVRDPIAREVSGFFQLGDRIFDVLEDQEPIETIIDKVSLRIEKLQDEEHSQVHTWFDNEIKTVFGIDVYSQPFDFEKGYAVFSNERTKVLLFRLEDLDRAFEGGGTPSI